MRMMINHKELSNNHQGNNLHKETQGYQYLRSTMIVIANDVLLHYITAIDICIRNALLQLQYV